MKLYFSEYNLFHHCASCDFKFPSLLLPFTLPKLKYHSIYGYLFNPFVERTVQIYKTNQENPPLWEISLDL